MSTSKHILVLGATGVSGIIFTRHVLALPPSSQPKLTLYVRSRSKLPKDIQSNVSIRVVEGTLADSKALEEAMSGITVVVSFLGAYVSIVNFLLHRTGPTPIADAMPIVCDAMRSHKVERIIALSTPSGFPQEGEISNMSWGWYLKAMLLPKIFVPQGDAEMRKIGEALAKQADLDWTVYRVPHLNEGDGELEVVAGHLGPEYRGTTELSRASLARWILKEIKENKWVKGAPMLGNP